MSTQEHFYLLDEKKLKTYLFLKLAIGDVTETLAGYKRIELKGVQYDFSDLTYLLSATPVSEHAQVLTTEGFVEWKNPARLITYSRNRYFIDLGTYVQLSSYTVTICSGYICYEYPPENHIKMTKDNMVAVDFSSPGQENLGVEIEEKNNELIITNKKNVNAWLGVKIENAIFPFYNITPLQEYKLILTKGTCFKVEKYNVYVINDKEKREFNYSNKELYLCY